jgi:phage/plasmid-associated DNA primase
MKDLTGGDTITCRPLYGDPIKFKPNFKIAFLCNHLPTLPPDDEGTWRRICLIDFRSRFVDHPDPNNRYEFQRDRYLEGKLYAWKEAFMFILLEHYKIYKKCGLVEPQSVLEATQQYQRNNDTYTDFIADCLPKDENSSAKLEDTYKVFKDWWRDNVGGKAPNRKDMKNCLEKKMGKYVISSKGGWHGYKLVVPSGPGGSGEEEKVVSTGQINEALAD